MSSAWTRMTAATATVALLAMTGGCSSDVAGTDGAGNGWKLFGPDGGQTADGVPFGSSGTGTVGSEDAGTGEPADDGGAGSRGPSPDANGGATSGGASSSGASSSGASSGGASSGGGSSTSGGGDVCPGGFNCACSSNADCDSAFCIEGAAGKVCAKTCVDACPAGFACKTVKPAGADVVSLCLPRFPRICDPCQADADCSGALGASENRCVRYANAGAKNDLLGYFCATRCDKHTDCPGGYACESSTSVSGATVRTCVKADKACGCSKRAIADGLTTTCATANEHGTCTGKRACSAAGLSACSAKVATAEACDGTDNDCDGAVDEGMKCDDNNTCTDDACVNGACSNTPTFAVGCDDNNLCTANDTCDAGVCKPGIAVDCNDGNACTQDSCDKAKGCSSTLVDGLLCDDGHACTGTAASPDKCVGGSCKHGALKSCDDADPCTEDACFPQKGCFHGPRNGPCNDGNPCTEKDTCVGGVCKGQANKQCDDNNPCTDSVCNPAGVCLHLPNKALCSDNNACTDKDRCVNGSCKAGKAKACNDANPCTTDSCHAAKGCLFLANHSHCNDGNPCTTSDECVKGKCKGTAGKSCNDGNPCTVDTCSVVGGCKHKPQTGAACSDNNACTINDRCVGASCKPGPAANCNDGNICTNDGCHAAKGCVHAANKKGCNDGNACTKSDRCSGGSCKPGKISCDDGDPCTNDHCAGKKCAHQLNVKGCTDPLFRFYRSKSKNENHYFSRSPTSVSGYKSEGAMLRIFQNPYPGTRSLYQGYASKHADHLQTVTLNEGKPTYGSFIRLGWCYPTKRSFATKPIYRLWQPKTKNHFITISSHERDKAVKNGYKYEGIVCWARHPSA